MVILRLLSEEVFDFSQDQLTSVKARNLKTSMTQEFSSIFQLCSEVLGTANQPYLVKATLETLLRFLNWIPLGYIFETPIVSTLLTRFLEVPEFRNVTLKCLTEIGGLQIGSPYNYDERLVFMFTETLNIVSKTIPLSMDLKQIFAKSNSRDQEFVLNLALFLSSFFSAHLDVCVPVWCSFLYWLLALELSLIHFLAYRETAKSRLSHARTLLPYSYKSDRRQGSFQDLLGILDQTCPRALRRNAAITDNRYQPACEHGRQWSFEWRSTTSQHLGKLSSSQTQIRRSAVKPTYGHDREDGAARRSFDCGKRRRRNCPRVRQRERYDSAL